MITCTAHAKLNLYLEITGKRDDGYHLLDSLFVFTDFGDQLTITADDALSLSIDGPFSGALSSFPETDNLVFKAAKLLQKTYQVVQGAAIKLTKTIPVSAGVGGGSSDAAAALRGLNTLWKLDRPLSELVTLALEIGADVPACLYQSALLVSGIGEQLKPASLPKQAYYAVLVNPNLPLSTAAIFNALQIKEHLQQPNDCITLPETHLEFIDFLKAKTNDLAKPAIQNLPVIETILSLISAQSGCLLARMSGSGPTCFGLFTSQDAARQAAQNIRNTHPTFWIQATQLLK